MLSAEDWRKDYPSSLEDERRSEKSNNKKVKKSVFEKNFERRLRNKHFSDFSDPFETL